MDRQLIEYLPWFMQKYREMKLICDEEQKQTDSIWQEVEKIWDNQFIVSADEETIKKWEHMLGVMVENTWTLQDRKNKILSIITEQRPYTDETLDIMLKTIFGENNYQVEYTEPFKMLISVSFDSKNEIKNVEKMLDRILPANLIWEVDIFHNKYSLLQQYTHNQLASYTHEEMRDKYMFE